MRSGVILVPTFVIIVACGGRVERYLGADGGEPLTPMDAEVPSDAGDIESGVVIEPEDAGSMDAGSMDAGLMDAGLMDAGLMDAGSMDAGLMDAGSMDAGLMDAGSMDAGGPPPGLSRPCSHGEGWTLFRFSYDGSLSPRIETWDASCSYSYAPGSACNVVNVGSVSLVHSDSAIAIGGSSYIRARFSVAGLSFTGAAVYVQARSYSTSASTYFELWSPIYGGVEAGPVDNDWVFDWYGVDWSGFLDSSDSPSLTAFELSAGRGSGSLAVHAVELCVY